MGDAAADGVRKDVAFDPGAALVALLDEQLITSIGPALGMIVVIQSSHR